MGPRREKFGGDASRDALSNPYSCSYRYSYSRYCYSGHSDAGSRAYGDANPGAHRDAGPAAAVGAARARPGPYTHADAGTDEVRAGNSGGSHSHSRRRAGDASDRASGLRRW